MSKQNLSKQLKQPASTGMLLAVVLIMGFSFGLLVSFGNTRILGAISNRSRTVPAKPPTTPEPRFGGNEGISGRPQAPSIGIGNTGPVGIGQTSPNVGIGVTR